MQAEAMGPGKQPHPLFESQAVLYCLVLYSDLRQLLQALWVTPPTS